MCLFGEHEREPALASGVVSFNVSVMMPSDDESAPLVVAHDLPRKDGVCMRFPPFPK